MFTNATQFQITGGTFYIPRVHDDLDRLLREVATNALHNSSTRFDPPQCHPNTRRAILENLHRWIRGLDMPDISVVWLYGPAGAGKSAIMQTLAEECADLGLLLAGFFFSKSDATRNHPQSFVATIAYQIAHRIPHLQPALQTAIIRDPLVFKKSISAQIQHLIVEPLKTLTATGFFNDRTAPRLILVDGLDECTDKTLRGQLLRSIATTVIHYHIPLIFLIASRPEQDIAHTFHSSPMTGLSWDSLVLDHKYKPNEDIRHFLEDSFTEIKSTHPHCRFLPPDWPGESTIESLVHKSSGQFIYAAVVVKYISELSDIPSRRLEVIMGLRAPKTDLPFVEIDAVYMHLLSSLRNPRAALDILSLVLYSISWMIEDNDIGLLLGMDYDEVNLELAPLSSIVIRARPEGSHQGILLQHESFSDFLLDKTRSGIFHVDLGIEWQVKMARQSVQVLNSEDLWLLASDIPYLIGHGSVMLNLLTELMQESNVLDHLYHDILELRLDTVLTHSMGQWSKIVSSVAFFIWLLKDQQPLLYRKHLHSLKPILSRHMATYLADHNLTAYMIICLTAYKLGCHWDYNGGGASKMMTLLDMPVHSFETERCLFNFGLVSASCSGIITDFLFDSSTPGHLSLQREHFTTTTLKVLRYLCKSSSFRSLRNLPLRNRTPRGRVSFFDSTELGRRRPHEIKPRELRVRRLQHGNRDRHELSSRSVRFQPCEIGLKVLPDLLSKCGRSGALIAFIRHRMKDIAKIQPWTRSARHALLNYLARVESGVYTEEDVEVAYYNPSKSLGEFHAKGKAYIML